MTAQTLHIVCPHCHTTNSIQADQLGSAVHRQPAGAGWVEF